ncbi:hypothetical protein, partial [Bradyrhizobium sp.]|uniref:hypothetical protein n=1 Tax=Bradyrhizobium sp. TaxID=376 RepID=UPI0025BECB59
MTSAHIPDATTLQSGMSADSSVTTEAVMPVVIAAAAAAIMTVGNAERPLDRADCAFCLLLVKLGAA